VSRARSVLMSLLPFLVGAPLLVLLQRIFPAGYTLILVNVGVNVVLAVSLNVVNGFTGQFSLGHAGFMAVGAYTAAKITLALAGLRIPFLPQILSDQLFFAFALTASMGTAALAGFLVGMPSLRLRGDYLAIVTLGFGEIIRSIIENLRFLGQATGLSGLPPRTNLVWVGVCAIATIVMARRLAISTQGRALFAIREDEVAAEAMGVHTTRAKVISFVVSSALAGIAGGLFAHYLMYINVRSFSFLKSFEIIIMIVIGGLGSISGSVLGAVLYITLTEGLREFAQYRMVLFSLLLIILMIVRPQGILGHKEFVTFLTRRRRSIGAAPGTPGSA
jgi:branched-chain amino acid transport system permease protein